MNHAPLPTRRAPVAAPLLAFLLAPTPSPAALGPFVSLSPITNNAYALSGINVVANARSTVLSYGNYEFVAYYGAGNDPSPGAQGARYLCIARRTIGSDDWTTVRTPYFLGDNSGNQGIGNDHNAAAIGIDGNGNLHAAFGTHGAPMRYIVSTAPVTGPTFTAPTWGAVANFGTGTASITDDLSYPEFYPIPNSKDLLFSLRDGGSGAGDAYLVRVTPGTGRTGTAFAPRMVIDGQVIPVNGVDNSVSAYPTNLVRDSQGRLLLSWVWRDTGGYQTNHDLLFARSPDNGATWTDVNGNPLTAPFTVANSQPVHPLPQGNSLINSTTLAVDKQDRPLIATWYAPLHAQGNEVRQYMLEYFDGVAWRSSQITSRLTESVNGGPPTTDLPTTDNDVRDLGRPLVLVDKSDRVIVILRYEDVGNALVAAYSSDRIHWDFLTLDSANLGGYEPAGYDRALWESENKLVLLHQPLWTGQPTNTLSVLQWDAAAYFASIPEPTCFAPLGFFLPTLLRRRPR